MTNEQRKIDWQQLTLGIIVLGVGVIIYIVDRPAAHTYFLPQNLSLYSATRHVFGLLGNYLPTFLHVFAFCMMTSALLGGDMRSAWKVCSFWFCIDSLFEIGQYPSIAKKVIAILPGWFSNVPILDNTANYLTYGRFDLLDLFSILLGGIVAYLLIRFMSARRDIQGWPY